MITISQARKWAKEARDDAWDKKCFALQRFMAGDPSFLSKLLGDGNYDIAGFRSEDMLEFPWTDPKVAMAAVQNHAYINAGINVHGVVYSTPELMCSVRDPLIRKANNSWFKLRYHEAGMPTTCHDIGMDVESYGIGLAELGIGQNGALSVAHLSKMDCLFDPAGRNPAEWEYIWFRRRLPKHKALAKYPGLTEDEFNEFKRAGPAAKGYSWQAAGLESMNGAEMEYIYEWFFWHNEAHHVVLGAISNEESPVYVFENGEYVRSSKEESGENPYAGIIPVAAWTDTWMSGALRPTSMLETAWRSASMLNIVEASIRETLLRGVALNIISAAGLEPEVAKAIKNANGPDDIEKYIVTEFPDPKSAIHRQPAAEIPASYLQALPYYRDQLNAATSVMDMQRGQALGGRKTASEIQTLKDAQGIGAHHRRMRYSNFLAQVATKGRMIEGMYGTKHTIIEDDEFILDSNHDDIAKVLMYPLDITIEESSLQYISQEARTERRLAEFQLVDLPAMQAGIGDPSKIFSSLYKSIGVVDPYSRMFTPEELHARQREAAMMSAAQAQDGETEQNKEIENEHTGN